MALRSSFESGGGLSRGDRKRAAILQAAQEAFFANGFLGTSMDQVAATAAVSKQTVYKHFSDKEALFREVVTNLVRSRDGGISEQVFSEGDGSLEERLRTFSRNFLKGVMQPDVLKLRRLVIGEVGRFPELGRVFYDLGPKRATEQLACALRDAADRHGLTMEHPEVAAEHLLSLILSRPLDQSMLLGDEFRFPEAAIDRVADEGVTAFVRAYGFCDG
jgi:AcrR family transcriptional regulator